MPSPQVNTLNCLILESKVGLKYIPSHFQVYFINSKRRFFLYFKTHSQMIQAMKLFTENSVRFYRRESLLPDREEQEEQIYHCCYRYKKMDLRRNLLPTTTYNEPKLHFDRYDRAKIRYEISKFQSPKKIESNLSDQPLKDQTQKLAQTQPFNGFNFKNQEVIKILENKALISEILYSLNFQ